MTPVFLLTLKNSKREFKIKKKLNLLGIKYKIFYAIDGSAKKNYEILDKAYDKKKSIYQLGRKMNYTEISNAEGHLRIYKYIVKNNIKDAVIIEDDCDPSKLLVKWLKIGKFFQNKKCEIIMLFHIVGMTQKKIYKKISNTFNLYEAAFVIPCTTCYQISNTACKIILKNNKKISRLVDWPINFYKGQIKQFAIIPRVVSLTKNHLESSYQKKNWKKQLFLKKIKKYVPFYNFLTAIYYLSHLPFFFGGINDYSYYKEKYLLKKILYIKNIFSSKYINLEDFNKN